MSNAYNRQRGIIRRPKVCNDSPVDAPVPGEAACRNTFTNPGHVGLLLGEVWTVDVPVCVSQLPMGAPIDLETDWAGFGEVSTTPGENGCSTNCPTVTLELDKEVTLEPLTIRAQNSGTDVAETEILISSRTE